MQGLPILFSSHALFIIAAGIASLFVPLYLLEQGYSLTFILGIYAVATALDIGIKLLLPKHFYRLGTHAMMIIGSLSCALLFGYLSTLVEYGWPIWILPILLSLQSIYWLGFHINFSRELMHREVGKEVGIANAVVLVAAGVAPLIGGIFATLLGAETMYLGVLGLFAAAGLIHAFSKEGAHPRTFRYSRLNYKKVKNDYIANAGNGISYDVDIIIWPLFIFAIVPSYMGVGALAAVTTLAAAMTSLYIGNRIKFRGAGRYIKIGSAGIALVNLARVVVTSPAQVTVANLFTGTSRSMLTAFSSVYYAHSEQNARPEYISTMEAAHSVGRLILFTALALASLNLTDNQTLILGFIIGGLASLAQRKIIS